VPYNSDYLQKQADKYVNQLIDTTVNDQIVRAYKSSLDTIKKQMAVIAEKYEVNGVLTYAEMTKYNRLNSTLGTVIDELRNLNRTVRKESITLAAAAYEESFFRYGYAIARGNNLNISFGLVNPYTIKAAVNLPFSGLTMTQLFERASQETIWKTQQAITQGLIQGTSYGKIAREIKDVLGTSLKRAMLIARTEASRAATQGQLALYEEAESDGIEMTRIWSAALDDRTRDAHGALDGQHADKDGLFHIDGMSAEGPGLWGDAAMDINCRCRVYAEVAGYPTKYRRVNGTVQDYMDYPEWYEKYGKKKK